MLLVTWLPAGAVGDQQVLIANGAVAVVADDFEAFLLRVPEAQRGEFRSSGDRVAKAVEQIYSNRVLAEEARRAGLDKSRLIALRAQQVQESFLAQAWLDHTRQALKTPDMVARAQELYQLNPEQFREPERLSAEYIKISLIGRRLEDAQLRASEARQKWLEGESFAQISALYNDDENFPKSGGKFRRIAPKDVERPVWAAAAALVKPGEITEPVRSGAALYLVKLEQKIASRVPPFSEVRSRLIASETAQFKGNEMDRKVGELKNTAQTKVYEENILKLVGPATPQSPTPRSK